MTLHRENIDRSREIKETIERKLEEGQSIPTSNASNKCNQTSAKSTSLLNNTALNHKQNCWLAPLSRHNFEQIRPWQALLQPMEKKQLQPISILSETMSCGRKPTGAGGGLYLQLIFPVCLSSSRSVLKSI